VQVGEERTQVSAPLFEVERHLAGVNPALETRDRIGRRARRVSNGVVLRRRRQLRDGGGRDGQQQDRAQDKTAEHTLPIKERAG
jgi:hypothetical protein